MIVDQHLIIMITHSLFLAAALFSTSAFPLRPTNVTPATTLSAPGGPPSIRIANKAKGEITAAEWKGVRDVDLAGCVPDARITLLTVCIKDCKGKDASLSTSSKVLSAEMRSMVQNLPPGTLFTVKVEVKDGSGKEWKVPAAEFTWRG